MLDTSRYAVSAATFPSYFLRKNDEKARLQMEVDVRLFAAHLAPAFGVTRRFVGHEPYCETTAAYNARDGRVPARATASTWSRCARTTDGDGFISATTRARRRSRPGDLDALASASCRQPTLAFLASPEGQAIARRLREQDSGVGNQDSV